ncbi:MAG: methylated-DNA--[protein]-cysteine S-methyltransferase [Acidobacteriota bacterium]
MYYCYLPSPVGPLLIAGDDAAVRRVYFPKNGKPHKAEPDWTQASRGPIADAAAQLREYFDGRRTHFDLPLAPVGTPFQRSVWKRLEEIPYGETISYAELARRVGNPKAARAVGSANGKNPLPIVIPCHRVIAADGTLGGFGGGLPTKTTLLSLETKK